MDLIKNCVLFFVNDVCENNINLFISNLTNVFRLLIESLFVDLHSFLDTTGA